MARFERAGEIAELWFEPGSDPKEPWPQVMLRHGGAPAKSFGQFAERHYFAEQLRLLGDGWLRVRDPLREVDVDGEPIEPQLEAAIRASDPGAVLVLGDWLQARGHPRGALIAAQHARETRPDDAALLEEEQVWLADDAITGTFARWLVDTKPHLVLGWERGFITRARIDGFFDRGESEDLLWELLRHPSARFLRELVLGCHHPGDQDNTLVAEMLMRADPTPPLRRLVLADFDDSNVDQIDISRAPIGDVAGIGTRYPLLEQLVLKGTGDVDLGELSLPAVRHFALRTSSLVRATFASVVSASWPALEDLEVWFGESEYGADCDAGDVVPLLARSLPKLRALRLMNSAFTDEMLPHVIASPLAAQLTTLDFSLGTLSDAGAELLAAARAAFPSLTRLVVYDCALSESGLARLRDAGFPVDETACDPSEAQCLRWRQDKPASYRRWRAPSCTQKTHRFVSVAE